MKKKKISITLFFTILICFLIILFEVFFLGVKYWNYKNTEFKRLEEVAESISHRCEMACHNQECNTDRLGSLLRKGSGMMKFGNFNNSPKGSPFNAEMKLKDHEFVLFDKNFQYSISSFQNQQFEKFLREKVSDSQIDNKGNFFEYKGAEFLYNYSIVEYQNKDNILVIFKKSELSRSDILFEILYYSGFTVGIGVLLFFILYYFVSSTLRPVEENIKDMEQFVHNAGHELKTPVSSAKSSLQVAKATGDYSSGIDETVNELDKMGSLIDSLIQMSTIRKDNNTQQFNVDELVRESVEKHKEEADKKDVSVNFEKVEDFTITANPDYFRILVSNLVSNAIRYNREGGEVEISLNRQKLEIKDNGEGITQEDKEKIFDRFFKASESRETQGVGIGLSLVKKIADIYGWKIEIDTVAGEGTTFRICF